MKHVGFHPEALAELRAAVEFYEACIDVIAVIHHRRRPGYWRTRIEAN